MSPFGRSIVDSSQSLRQIDHLALFGFDQQRNVLGELISFLIDPVNSRIDGKDFDKLHDCDHSSSILRPLELSSYDSNRSTRLPGRIIPLCEVVASTGIVTTAIPAGMLATRLNFEQIHGFNALYTLVKAIEAAQSLDPKVVAETWGKMKTITTSFGEAKMGGLKTYGLNHNVYFIKPIMRLEKGELLFGDWIPAYME